LGGLSPVCGAGEGKVRTFLQDPGGHLPFFFGEQHPVVAPVPERPATHLTPRELQLVELIVQGIPIKEMAVRLDLSPKTVPQYLAHLYAKLGVHSRAEVAAWRFREGIRGPEREAA